MSVKEIKAAIAGLPAKELAELMAWLDEFHAQMRDSQIEDASDLDAARAAIADAEAHGTTPWPDLKASNGF